MFKKILDFIKRKQAIIALIVVLLGTAGGAYFFGDWGEADKEAFEVAPAGYEDNAQARSIGDGKTVNVDSLKKWKKANPGTDPKPEPEPDEDKGEVYTFLILCTFDNIPTATPTGYKWQNVYQYEIKGLRKPTKSEALMNFRNGGQGNGQNCKKLEILDTSATATK